MPSCSKTQPTVTDYLQYTSNKELEALHELVKEMGGATFVPNHVTIREIVANFCKQDNVGDEPFYIVDLYKIVYQMLKWRALLPRVKPFYAVKCNPSAPLVRIIEAMGGNFDCASKAEIEAVLALGVDPAKRIIFANPCKQISHICYANSVGVEMVTLDSEEEMQKVSTHWSQAKCVLRIKTDDSNSVCKLSSKFGASLQDAEHLIGVAKQLGLNLSGVSFHVGSRCKDTMSFVKALKDARTVFDMAAEQGLKFDILDIGGGWPGNDDHEPSFEAIANAIRDSIDELFPADVQVIAEPGRYFCSASHTLVTNIFAKRQVRQKNDIDVMYSIGDGVYGAFNGVIFEQQEVQVNYLTAAQIADFNNVPAENEKTYKSILFGPTCDSMDVISKCIELPNLSIGDWMYFENYGAYTTSVSGTFNGFKTVKFHLIWKK